MTKLNTFTESSALERTERIIGGDREGLRAGIGNWKGVKVSKNPENFEFNVWYILSVSWHHVPSAEAASVYFRHICGSLRGASLISQKNANLNLVDFHGGSYTSTLNILNANESFLRKSERKFKFKSFTKLNLSFLYCQVRYVYKYEMEQFHRLSFNQIIVTLL